MITLAKPIPIPEKQTSAPRKRFEMPKFSRRQLKVMNTVLMGIGIGCGFAGMLLWQMSSRQRPPMASSSNAPAYDRHAVWLKRANAHNQHLSEMVLALETNKYVLLDKMPFRSEDDNVFNWSFEPAKDEDTPGVLRFSAIRKAIDTHTLLSGAKREWLNIATPLRGTLNAEISEQIDLMQVIWFADAHNKPKLASFPYPSFTKDVIRRDWSFDDDGELIYKLEMRWQTAEYAVQLNLWVNQASAIQKPSVLFSVFVSPIL